MAKIQRNFRIDKELDSLLKNVANEKGITVSQLIELSCSSLINFKAKNNNLCSEPRKNKITVLINTTDKTYQELVKRVEQKNSTLSQEINFILRASLTNNSFSKIEFSKLNLAITDLNRLGNLFKLSLNNRVNSPDLLAELGNKIDEINRTINDIILDSSQRRIKK